MNGWVQRLLRREAWQAGSGLAVLEEERRRRGAGCPRLLWAARFIQIEDTGGDDCFCGPGEGADKMVWFGGDVYSLIHPSLPLCPLFPPPFSSSSLLPFPLTLSLSLDLSVCILYVENHIAKDKAISFAESAVFFVIFSHTEPWNTAME